MRRAWRIVAARAGEAFGPTFLAFLAVAVASGAASYYVIGETAFLATFGTDLDLLRFVLPRMAAAFLIAGFIRTLIPDERIARWAGGRSGLRGIAIAGIAGAGTPGGAVMAFSLVGALKVAGADRGVLVAYATGWGLLGVQRIVVWEVPLLGADFFSVRLAVSFLLPMLAGVLARHIPIGLEQRPADSPEDGA